MSSTTPADTEPEDGASAVPDRLSRRAFVGRSAAVAVVAGTTVAARPAGALASPKAPRAVRSSARTSVLPSVADVKAADRDLVDHEVVELAALLQAGEISSVELTQAYIARIKALNGPFETYADNGLYNAFVRIDEAGALAEAKIADGRLAEGRRSGGTPAPFLCGIPMGFKDSIGTAGFAQQNGDIAFAGNVALEDSTPVGRLRDQGVVALGITICSAFSGIITGTFAGNAWNPAYVPGGSSQGSGCAPIARLAAACLGEETGGSIIFPGAANGASTIKPSLGLGSTAGVMPLSPSYDVIGPIARSGRDAALIMNAIKGPDPVGDPQTVFAPIPFPEIPMTPRLGSQPLKGLTFGVNKKDWLTTLNPGSLTATATRQNVDPQSLYAPSHAAAFDSVIAQLKRLGAEVKDFDGADFLVFSETENPFYNSPDVLQTIDGSAISPSAAVINPNRYDIRYIEAIEEFASTRPAQSARLLPQYGRRAGGVPASSGVPLTFAAATTVLAGVTASVRAEGERRRRQWAANYKRKMDEAGVDIMLVMSLGDKPAPRRNVPANQVTYAVRRNNQLANSLSFPMVSFPIGYVDGLPISVELKGPRFSEGALTQVMIDYQARFPEYNAARPPDPTAVAVTARAARGPGGGEARGDDPTLSNDPSVHEVVVG